MDSSLLHLFILAKDRLKLFHFSPHPCSQNVSFQRAKKTNNDIFVKVKFLMLILRIVIKRHEDATNAPMKQFAFCLLM